MGTRLLMSVLTRRFNGGVLAARRARRAVRDELSGELPERTLDDVELLVSELATNSVRHGGCDEDAELRVETDVTPSCIRIRLCDTGSGFAEPRAEPSPPDAAGGFGLVLLDRISDRWGTQRNGGFCVWFEVQRAPAAV